MLTGVAFISSADRNFWTGTLILVCQVESVAERGGVLSIQGAHGALLQAVQGPRRGDWHTNTLELLDLDFDGFKAGRLAEAGHHVKEEVGVWRTGYSPSRSSARMSWMW